MIWLNYIFILFSNVLLSATDKGVCTLEKKHYKTADIALAKQKTVLHCGKCGACSNINDIKEYYRTRETMTKISRSCAFRLINPINGRKKAQKCMIKKTNLSEKCLDCWLDNMECTKKNCLFKCLLAAITTSSSLYNECLKCDENKCGKEFLKCAGANRRNSGIITDISREKEEICPHSLINF